MARILRTLASNNRAKLALEENKKAKVVETILPPPPPRPQDPPPVTFLQGPLVEGADYGEVKVENGKLVVDMADFSPDYGTF
jgi:hypothetical protein